MLDRIGSEKLGVLILIYVVYVKRLKIQNYLKNIIIFKKLHTFKKLIYFCLAHVIILCNKTRLDSIIVKLF